ncbi:predicted protein [Naegleria gruberi]|uniref:Predicted protein n=1 Tax=Naegleria gruberi TaxID=5762 RepID=D2VHF3_NAEGR|nr:uncharacterized protein NAEGRDRAFT_49566 [Naegleria gruberi]EFC43578.1 predicted protein [Naegleria gruberi]|eukprot:XP_002676322.1 predicted protein [Naegleria gruberi strain NEG-M]
MPKRSVTKIIPMYESIYDLPVVMVCMKGEKISDEAFINHLYFHSSVFYPTVNDCTKTINTIMHELENVIAINDDFIIDEIPNPMDLKEKLQLSRKANRLAIYSLKTMIMMESKMFNALFQKKPSMNQLNKAHKFQNVIHLEIDEEDVSENEMTIWKNKE